MTILDIIPTGEVWARADRGFALGYWHWSFLVQPQAEEIIGQNAELFFFRGQYRATVGAFSRAAYADYVESLRDPKVIHAICEDYRAGARFDRELDEQDRPRAARSPARSRSCGAARARWRPGTTPWRSGANGRAMFAATPSTAATSSRRRKPAETLAALRSFHAEGR
jgi:haloacetate dehalogenase